MATKGAVEAYPVAEGGYNQQGYNPPPYNTGYQQEGYQPSVVAEPYNGPTAQQATVVAGPHGGGQVQPHVVIVQHHGQQRAAVRKPHSYCILAWFSCLCCFWPIGLCAIFQAYQVNKAFNRQDFDGAFRSSDLAKKLSLLAIVCGIVIAIVASVTETSTTSEDVNSGDGSYEDP